MLCPRKCGAERTDGKYGVCNSGKNIRVARAALHFWEEPCISGESGSGAVFFSGCPLKCVYCQNKEISRGTAGKEITAQRLAEIFFELENKGANNINLVTPTHFLPQIKKAADIARANGFSLPFVYNCGGYEDVNSLKSFKGYADIYLPDFKYMSPNLAKKYSNAENYPEIAKKAIEEMIKQTGKPEFYENGIIKKGVIVRHLVLPGYTDDSKQIIKYLHSAYGNDIYLSIMNQYTPLNMQDYPEINRAVTSREYDDVIDYAIRLGVENAFIQEGGTVSESFIPDFNCEGV